jgi:hypothetical protein
MKSFGARAATLVLIANVVGCAATGTEADDEGLDTSEHVSTPIVGGSPASAYPEAVLLDLAKNGVVQGACSGTIIAPRVVLTAGHCVDGFTGWIVRAPLLNQQSTSSAGETFDWKDDGSGNVNGKQHDLGLVYLDRPITASYPALASGPLHDGSSIVAIGRKDNGTLSSSGLFVSKPLTVTGASLIGYPHDYMSNQVIESGDSGGPVVVPGTTPHALVAVNSGAGAGKQVLARVDLLKTWIDERVATHGGAGAAAQPSPPAAAPASPAPTAPAACSGPSEIEPNDDFRAPNALAASACGSVSGTDRQDWYTWTIDGPVPYSLKLATTGDAAVVMWKVVNGQYARVQNTSLVELSHTASGPGTYLVAVFSPAAAAQTYSLTLQK